MTPSINRIAGFIVCALFILAGFAPNQAVAEQTGPVRLAAKDGAALEKPPARYEETMQKAMETVLQTIKEIEAEESLSLEEKQQRAMDFVRNYRWGMDGKQYFWINDLQGRMLMHPTNPQLEGQILTNMRDADGKLIFVEFIAMCLEKGGGFVNYLWPNPTGQAPEPKTSLVQLYKPFGWVVGTGLYMETIEAYDEPIEPDFFVPLVDPPPDDRRPASPV